MYKGAHIPWLGLAFAVWGKAALAVETADDMVGKLLAETEAPGAVVAVLREGGLDVAFGGFRVAEQPTAIGENDLWHIGSNAKSMTATLVARLVEAGKISWDDTVDEVLGEAIPEMHPSYRDATYVNLLEHRTGLPANIGRFASLGLAGTLADRDIRADRLSYASTVLAMAPEHSPEGNGFLYSNAGYVIVGAMLEAETGVAWEDLIRIYVTDPLGMTTVGFGAPGVAGAADQPRGHRAGLLGGLNPVEPGPGSDNIPAMGPAGTLHLSAVDMMRFLRVHAEEDPAFLSAESWVRLHQPAATGADYALGWGVDDDCLVHSGSNTLWFARMMICPDRKAAAFVAVNSGDIEALRGPVAGTISTLLAD
jgi:D-alanyl-D-alanine carboxypeptidase